MKSAAPMLIRICLHRFPLEDYSTFVRYPSQDGMVFGTHVKK